MNEKDKGIKEAMGQIHKKFGVESVIRLDKNIDIKVESIPTGCFSLDYALGCGGLPKGRIIEVFGKESSGKSTLTTFMMAQAQKAGGKVALIDAEFAFDAEYAKSIGLDLEKVLLSQPKSLEEAMEIVNILVKNNAVDIIVVDSVAALVPQSEIDGSDMLKESMAVQARLMSKALRILTGSISQSKTVVVFINQLREKVGVFFGSKDTTPGGNALKYYSSIRINVSKGDQIKNSSGDLIGHTLKLTMVKNKVGYPYRQATFDLYFGAGVDLSADAVDFGEKIGVLEKVGNTYFFDNKKIGVGRSNAIKALNNDKTLFDNIVKSLKENKKTSDKGSITDVLDVDK